MLYQKMTLQLSFYLWGNGCQQSQCLILFCLYWNTGSSQTLLSHKTVSNFSPPKLMFYIYKLLLKEVNFVCSNFKSFCQLDVLPCLFLSELCFSQTGDHFKVGFAEILNISPFMSYVNYLQISMALLIEYIIKLFSEIQLS